MNLPEKFQFRLKEHPGFTHSAKVDGDVVKVKWARGWHQHIDDPDLWSEGEAHRVKDWLAEGGWMIVDENKRAEENKPKYSALPDEFYCTWLSEPTVYHAKRVDYEYVLTWGDGKARYELGRMHHLVADKTFRIVEKYKYPDVFHIKTLSDTLYTFTRDDDKWICTEYGKTVEETYGSGHPATYPEKELDEFVGKAWTLYEPKKLTPEQLARNKEIQEQIEQLNKSIDECDNFKENLWVQTQHYNTLIKSYEDRIEVLKKGLVEE